MKTIACDVCGRMFVDENAVYQHTRMKHGAMPRERDDEPDYEGTCLVCGATPVNPLTGMCGPCTTGEADTADGNW